MSTTTKVARWRQRAGLTQAQLVQRAYPDDRAQHPSLTQRYGRIERGQVTPTEEELSLFGATLADVLDLDPTETINELLNVSQTPLGDHLLSLERMLDLVTALLAERSVTGTHERKYHGKLTELIRDAYRHLHMLESIADHEYALNSYCAVHEPHARYRLVRQMFNYESLIFGPKGVSPRDVQAAIEALSEHAVRGSDSAFARQLGSHPVDQMTAWVNRLRHSDRLFATHYIDPSEWDQDAWVRYLQANIRAALKGVRITRHFIYSEPKELYAETGRLHDFIRIQQEEGIDVRFVHRKQVESAVVDIAVFLNDFIAMLSFDEARHSSAMAFFSKSASPHSDLVSELEGFLNHVAVKEQPE